VSAGTPSEPRGTSHPSVVVLVEGRSDVAAVAVLCTARGLSPTDGGFALVDMGGVTNVGHHLTRLRTVPGGPRVLGLCDAPEERFVVRALRREGLEVDSRDDLARAGFVVCDRDLEDELIRALGPDRVERVVERLGQLEQLRAFQRQPQWRGRDVHDQLRRFAGTASGRKELFARGLAEELTPDETPPPLARLLDTLGEALESASGEASA
jgi:hypothetical protein